MPNLAVLLGAAIMLLDPGLSGFVDTESVIEIRAARTNPGPGFLLIEEVLAHSELYVAQEAIVSDGHIENVQAIASGEALILDVFLTREGAGRLEEATADELVTHLVVFVDSEPVTAAVVIEPISGPRVQIGIDPKQSDVDTGEIAAVVAERWPG